MGVLNSDYQKPSYGLGNASTIYPISAFITHLVWLEGTTVDVDVAALTVSLVSIVRRRSYVCPNLTGPGCQVCRGQGRR